MAEMKEDRDSQAADPTTKNKRGVVDAKDGAEHVRRTTRPPRRTLSG